MRLPAWGLALVGCRGAEPGPPIDTPPSAPTHQVPFSPSWPAIEEPIRAMLHYGLGTGVVDGVVGPETTPYVYARFREEPTLAMSEPTPGNEQCSRSWPAPEALWGRDLGPTMELTVGVDVLTLRRRSTGSEQYYEYDPIDDLLDVGHTTGAPLSLLGDALGVVVPEPVAWVDEVEAVHGLGATGVLDLSWTPASTPGRRISIDLRLYDVAYREDWIACILDDDGRAVIETGHHGGVQALELSLGPVSTGTVEHPNVGRISSMVHRYHRHVLDYLLEAP